MILLSISFVILVYLPLITLVTYSSPTHDNSEKQSLDYGPQGYHNALDERGKQYLAYIARPKVPITTLPGTLRKVVVPAVYTEWLSKGMPYWVDNRKLHKDYGFEIFLYQKSNASAPNYISSNRGLEAGVYLRYIVDFYNNFPDFAIFLHGFPGHHSPGWLNYVKCLKPSMNYSSINNGKSSYTGKRSVRTWKPQYSIWIEQCYRDVLKITFGLEENSTAFHESFPVKKALVFGGQCCSQFIMSRAKVHQRPLATWKKLLHIIGEQNYCHEGPPDYKNLNSFRQKKVGPEPENLDSKPGRFTQVNAMEHLGHTVYGGDQRIFIPMATMDSICKDFLRDDKCPRSPCQPKKTIEQVEKAYHAAALEPVLKRV